jgi:two-component sensor histidine kinase
MIKVRNGLAYWACQFIGWGSYSAAAFAVVTAFIGWQSHVAVGFVLFFCYSIALTHLLRAVILRSQWTLLPPVRGLPRMFACAVAAGAVQVFLVVTVSWAQLGYNTFDTIAFVSAGTGIVFMTCAWTAIYAGVHWYRRYREAQLREVQSQLAQRQAELRALEAQVHPHFLFNALNVIRGTVAERPEKARDMITSLANLLRRSLRSDSSHLVPLAEEMAAVADYLALESARFEERIRVRVEVAEDAERCAVPAMLVQTLVENAVKHGISHLTTGGAVRIRGFRRDRSLIVEVENDGKLLESNGDGPHTGIANARDRLRLLCGDNSALELFETNGSVTARAVIPQPS